MVRFFQLAFFPRLNEAFLPFHLVSGRSRPHCVVVSGVLRSKVALQNLEFQNVYLTITMLTLYDPILTSPRRG
jgi:hypothetical protein